ncbi:TPA: hypothetical protein ACH3X1_006504 [Trebouxia sp. C0004]
MQVLLGSVRITRARRTSQTQVNFETQWSHPRTACLWDLTLAMQPSLTASALLPMAASAASMLAPNTQSHRHPGSGVAAVLVDTIVTGPLQLPGVSQIRQDPGCAVVQLSLEIASGCVSITYNGAAQMQTVTAGTDAACSTDRLSHGSAGYSPEALTALLGASIMSSGAGPHAAVFGDFELAGSDQSGYALHPAILEAHVSLRALTTAQTDSAPIWLNSAAATAVFAMPTAATSFTAMLPLQQHETIACGVFSANHHPALSQEGVVFAGGQAPIAAVVAEVARGVSASHEAIEEGGLPADNTMLQMGAHERKLYIQAQVANKDPTKPSVALFRLQQRCEPWWVTASTPKNPS